MVNLVKIMSTKVVAALAWIKQILEAHQVPYQIVGGLAATIHGGQRPVADIDMYMPPQAADKIMPAINAYISKPLKHYREGQWDLEYCQLIYKQQKIEIGLSPGTKIYNPAEQVWLNVKTDYQQSVQGKYQNIEVPTIPVQQLIAYKKLLGREVDLIDITELSKIHGSS